MAMAPEPLFAEPIIYLLLKALHALPRLGFAHW